MVARALLVATLAAGAAEARPAVGGDGLDRIGHYQVLTYRDPGGDGVIKGKAIALFDATPDEVYRVATEYERYPEFAPHVVSSKVVDRAGDTGAQVMLNTDLPWPVSHAWVYAQFAHDRLAGDVYRVRFWQIKGSMKRYFGSILIEPWQRWNGGGTSTVTYELLFEPDSSAPLRMVNQFVERAASRYVHALRQRINELRRIGRLHPAQPPDPHAKAALDGREPVHAADVARARR
jgi:ribosome-associated toxin RatA of RatAB toxin-antitoxin module